MAIRFILIVLALPVTPGKMRYRRITGTFGGAGPFTHRRKGAILMSPFAPALEVMWVIFKWGIPFVLLLAVGTWARQWIEEKVSVRRPIRARKPRRSRKEKRAEVGRLAREKGLAFEAELSRLFRAAGWEVEETPLSGDNGVDLIVRYRSRRYAIQAKDHRSRVGPGVVDAVYSGRDFHECDTAIIIAPGGVTDQARAKAAKLGVLIWGTTDIVRLHTAAQSTVPTN
jgi:hypothetical protein